MKFLLPPLSIVIALCMGSLCSHADTLADIYELSLKNDATLKAAEATYRANIETEKQAFSALLPQISGSASYQETNSEQDSLRTNQDTDTGDLIQFPISSDSYSVRLTQNIFDLPTWFTF